MRTHYSNPVRGERTSDSWHPHNDMGIWHNINIVPLVWPEYFSGEGTDIEKTRESLVLSKPPSKSLKDVRKIVKETIVLCGIPDTKPNLEETIKALSESLELTSKALKLVKKEIADMRRKTS